MAKKEYLVQCKNGHKWVTNLKQHSDYFTGPEEQHCPQCHQAYHSWREKTE